MTAQRLKGLLVVLAALCLGGMLLVMSRSMGRGVTRTGNAPPPDGSPKSVAERFERAYSLNDGEALRLIPIGQVPERDQMIAAGWLTVGADLDTWQTTFRFGDPQWPLIRQSISSSGGTVASAVVAGLEVTQAEMEIDPPLRDLSVPGDWIVRWPLDREARRQALQAILRTATGRPIIIERQVRHRESIVARGPFKLTPLAGVKNQSAVHLYVNRIDENAGRGGGTGTAADLMKRLADATGIPFVDQTGHEPRDIEWRNHDEDLAAKDPAALDLLLTNVTKQSGLTFSKETLDVEVFVVREDVKGR